MKDETKKTILARLRRIEGQVGGLVRMVEADRYCVDVITQVQAIRAALTRAEDEILRDHMHHCVAGAFSSGNRTDQSQKIEELITVLRRAGR